MAIHALLLDFDGTLADSLGAMRRVYERFVTNLGGVPSNAEFNALNGPPLRDVVEGLCAAHASRPYGSADMDSYQGLIREELCAVKPSMGAEALLDAAAKRGIKCGLVTSGKAVLVDAWLDASGLRCTLIVSGDDVANGKPSPDPYLLAVERLGVSPADALAIEDSPAGVASASAAGIPTLHFTTGAHSGSALARISNLAQALPYLDGSMPR